jgi:hypothetical protein
MVSFTIVLADLHVRPGNGGMTSFDCRVLAGALGDQYLAHMTAVHDQAVNYHAGHLFTGKECNGPFDTTIGSGGWGGVAPDFQAHWSIAQQVSCGPCRYQATNYARMQLNSHEIGHTYNGAHAHAVRIRVCIFILCYDYHTIMREPYQGDQWMLSRFSDSVTDNRPPADANRDRIHTDTHIKVQR